MDNINGRLKPVENNDGKVVLVTDDYKFGRSTVLLSDIIENIFTNFGGYEVVDSKEDGNPNVDEPLARKIYLVKNGTKFIRWIFAEGQWICIGDIKLDLSKYVKDEDIKSITDDLATIKEQAKEWNTVSDKISKYDAENKFVTVADYAKDSQAFMRNDAGFVTMNDVSMKFQPISEMSGYVSFEDPCIHTSNCSAYGKAQAFGNKTIMSGDGMAIGSYNKTSSFAAFVIGDGTSGKRSDALKIDNVGNIKTKGYVKCQTISTSGILDVEAEIKNNLKITSAAAKPFSAYDIRNNAMLQIKDNDISGKIQFNVKNSSDAIPNVYVEIIDNKADFTPSFKINNKSTYHTDKVKCESGKNYQLKLFGSVWTMVEMKK